jgi:serine/threonine protein kinase
MLGRDKQTSQYCAIKILKKAKVVRLKQVEHSLQENRILLSIHFPFLVNLVTSFQVRHACLWCVAIADCRRGCRMRSTSTWSSSM